MCVCVCVCVCVYIYTQSHTTHTCCMSTHDENRNSWQTNSCSKSMTAISLRIAVASSHKEPDFNNIWKWNNQPVQPTHKTWKYYIKIYAQPCMANDKIQDLKCIDYFSYMLKLFHVNYNTLASYSDFSCSWLLLIKSYSEALWFMNTNNCDVWKWANWVLLLPNLKHMHWKESLTTSG